MTTHQHSIGSGFGARSTAYDVLRGIDLSGRTAIVTGGSSGLGPTDAGQAARLWDLSAGLTGVDAFTTAPRLRR